MKMELANKSKDNSTLTFKNGRQFIVESKYISIVENWKVGSNLDIKPHDSKIPYSHEIINPTTKESIFVGISGE